MIVFTRHLCDGCGLEFDVGEGESAYVVHPNVPSNDLGWAMRLAFEESLATFCDRACFERLLAAARTDLLDPIRDELLLLMRGVGQKAREAKERAETFGREQPCERVQRPDPDVAAAYASLAQEPHGGVPCGFAEANDPPIRPLGDDEPQRPNQPAPADL